MNKYPAIRFTVIFICGIIINYYYNSLPLLVTASFVLLFLYVLFNISRKKEYAVYVLIFVPLLFGYFIASLNYEEKLPYTELKRVDDFTASGRINSVEINDEEVSFILKTGSVYFDNIKDKQEALILCKIKRYNRIDNSLYNKLYPGNYIEVSGLYYRGRERRNPGEFDYNKYLNRQGISGLINVKAIKILNGEKDYFASFFFDMRKSINKKISALHSPQAAALVEGLLTGNRSGFDYETKQSFINSGVIHILAVSGFNVTCILFIVLALAGRLNPVLRASAGIVFILFFLFITGLSASVVRAVLMSILVLLAFLLNRNNNIFNSLAVSAFIILVIEPSQLFDAGFQLSYAAVLSIVLLVPYMEKPLKKYNIKNKAVKYLYLLVATSLCAQIGTLPFTLYYFQKFSVVALAANLVVIPLTTAILPAGIITVIISYFSIAAAGVLAGANEMLCRLVFLFINWTGHFDFSFISISDFSLFDSVAFYLFLIFFVYSVGKMTGNLKRLVFFCLTTAAFFTVISFDSKELLKDNYLNVYMIDVGQGDAILIKFPGGKTALIDAGEAGRGFDNGERIIKPLINYLGVKKIDYGFVSHIDADHYGGFISLVESGLIGEIYKPPLDSSLSKDIKFEELLRNTNTKITYYSNQKINIGGAAVYILNNPQSGGYNLLGTNDQSGIIKVVYGNSSILFTGDAGSRAENFYTDNYKNFLESNVLKVAHHGSNTCSGKEFLNHVKPGIALISCGYRNKFYHPALPVLKRIKENKAKILRTDLSGGILLLSDGKKFTAEDWRNF